MKSCTKCKARFTGNPTRCPLDGSPLIDLPDPLLGKTIGGRYRVESKIGAGGMASVYRASQDPMDRKVAIKFLAPELALDPTQRERFLREARATNRIKHENIVDITDYGQDDSGLVYLVMELLEGEALAQRIARGPIPPGEAIDYLAQVARALARAHELEVIHRDLKPENVFLVPRVGVWQVKLLDFGLAHVRNEARLTASGAVFGTPEYMSPEQARGAPVGPGSDLYALGVVFFEMLTSQLPFEGSTAELIVKHLRASPPSPSSIHPAVPRELDALVLKMLAKDPAQRHRDAYHLLEELQTLRALYPGAVPKLDSAPAPPVDPSATLAYGAERPRVEHPTAVPVSVRSWVERRAVFRSAITAAYPSGAPEWVERLATKLQQLVDRAVVLEQDIARVARALADREAQIDATRARIGRALDELSREDSAYARQLDDLDRRAERAHARAGAGLVDLQRGFRDALAAMPEGVPATPDDAQALEAVARRATAWRQTLQEVDEVRAHGQARRVAREDLRFQMGQLKGRLAAFNAEAEMELTALRDRASDLGAQLAQTQDELADAGDKLAAHLAEFPAARPLIAQGIGAYSMASAG